MFSVSSIPYLCGVAVFAYFMMRIRQYLRGVVYTGTERLDGKTVVITGGNAGIGKVTALELARRGGRIIMASRDLGKCKTACDEIVKETGNKQVEYRYLDLGSFASIHKFANDINANEDRVDILINNAGVLTGNKRPTEDGLERHMGVNHYGHFLLTQLLLDKLKASAPSRIIFVSAWVQFYWPMDFDHWPQNKKWFFKAYGQSKLANVLTARELSRRLKGTNVIVNTAHPGFIHTDIARDFPFYHSRIVQLLNSPFNFLLFRTPFLGAQPTLRLALDSSLANVSGKYFGFQNEENDPGWAGTDDEAAAKLWRISESVTKTGDM